MSGRSPPSYCTLTLIAMQGHQQKGRQTNTSSNNKDKSNTIIETSTAEDHDDENLHNPSTRPRYSPGSRRRAVGDHTSLKKKLFKGTSQRYSSRSSHLSTCPFIFSHLQRSIVQTAFIPYYLSTDIDFVCVLRTSSSTAAVASISLPLSLCLCSGVPHTTISPFLYLPFNFFAATTKCLYKRHLFPASLLARVIFRFVTTGLILCTPLYATN